MKFKKYLLLFIYALYFLCALCDDEVRELGIDASTKSNDDSGETSSNNGRLNSGSQDNYEIMDRVTNAIKNYEAIDYEFTENGGYTNTEHTESFSSSTNYDTITTESTIKNELSTDIERNTAKSFFPIIDYFTQTTLPTITTVNTITTTSGENVTTNNSTTDGSICCAILMNIDGVIEVVNLVIDNSSTEWIALSWKSPCKDSANVSITYLIERCDGNNCTQTNQPITSHNATNLEPCTKYTFNVKIVTKSWKSNGSNISATTDHDISEIGDVLNLEARKVSINNIQLTWQKPVVYAKCISNYTITQCNPKDCKETTVFNTNHNAVNLEPCTAYEFTVKTVTSTVESAGVNVTEKTASPKLSAPEFLRIKTDKFSLSAEWKPPQYGANCLKLYRVTIDPGIDPGKATFNTTKNKLTIPNLYACTSYDIYINGINEDNENGETVSKSGTTRRSVTKAPISHTPGDLVTANSISLIWSVEKENNHCPLKSIITVCNYTASNGTGYEFVNGVSITELDSTTATAPVVVTNTTVEKLSPFTSYTCWAYTINTAGFSELSNEVTARTSESVPSSPEEFHVTNITDTQFSFTWSVPQYLPGNLEGFEITLKWEELFPIPEWCVHETALIKENTVKLNKSVLNYDHVGAKPFTNYTVTIKAKTMAGWGNYSAPQTFQTNRAVPGIVSKILPYIKENPDDRNILDMILTWGLPCSLNGELEVFNVSVYGIRNEYTPHSFYIMHDCADYINNDYMCSINLQELKGEYNYTFAISTKVMNIDTFGPKIQDTLLYPAGIPPQPEEEYIKALTIDPYKSRKSTTTATVLLPLFSDINGSIKYYAIMISEIGHNNNPSSKRFKENETWPDTFSWEESMMKDFSITYQATRPRWDPYPKYIADYGHMKAVKYMIGEDTDCKEISSNSRKQLFCNGPLKPDTWYHVRMRAFTNGGYSDSIIFVVKTNAELKVGIIIGVVFGILFLGILTTMLLLVRKCSPYMVLRRFIHSDMPDSPVPAPFTRKKFIAHCQQLVDNPGKLSNEFRLLQTLSVDLQMPTNSACLQANRKKNRYSDILPYDFSRVKLDVIDNDPNTDYINASFIRGYRGEDEYIACQGPKEETTYDFWRMVDQYNIDIIIMLTQLIEKGKEKCHQYFPTIRESFRYENMTIRCTSELEFRTYTQRTLVLQKENKKRNITHLHFKDWPDHDVPEDFDPMINFCQIMRRNINANKGFVVVHCSAGIGRTGTLIAIDILLQHLRDNRKLDVFGTVYRLRHHRINMVQRESQYAYIYNCIKQVLKNPYFLKTYKPPLVEPIYENISKNAKDAANSDVNLVSNLEILQESNNSISMESLESTYNFFPLSNTKSLRSIANNGLRHYKSTGAINVKSCYIAVGKSKTLECVIYKSLKDSSRKLSYETLTEENYPLLTSSKSADVLGDSMQYATDNI